MTRANNLGTLVAGLLDRLERQAELDQVIAPVRSLGQRLVGSGRRRDVMSGTQLGHAAHPVVVDLPIGFWTSAMVLDVTAPRQRRAARRLVGLGVLAALPAVATGLSDWVDTDGAEARVGLVHATANTVALICYSLSWWGRRRGGYAGQLWSGAGATAATVGGWLGGHLAYGLGVGVDTNAFETGPEEWTRAGRPPPLDGTPTRLVAGGVRVMAVRSASGVHALADRCSHRGGPLSEGELDHDCITCPWHGSQFDLRTGVATRGPASVAQPVYELRESLDGVELRRDEPRTLRQRAVRPGRQV
jgi:nitrite reductase/ring-hydroxylating ferredoxin subunit/uncharacterized membrane protein